MRTDLPRLSFDNPSPIGQQLEDVRGVQEILPTLSSSTYYYFVPSSWFLSKYRPRSTAWVTLENSCVFILDSTHLKRSGSRVMDVLTLLRFMSSLAIRQYDSILPQHINIVNTLSYNVILKEYGTNRTEGEWNGREH